jgi:signal transduction histidine kinase
MKPRLAFIFLLLVLAPLVLLAWLGMRAGEDERRRVEDRFREVFAGQLADVQSQIRRVVGEAERDLAATCDAAAGYANDPAKLRAAVRRGRLLRQIFVRSPSGDISFPPDGEASTDSEAAFFDRTRSIWDSGVDFGVGGAYWQLEFAPQVYPGKSGTIVSGQSGAGQRAERRAVPQQQQSLNLVPDPASGWYGWFWGEGLNWIFWRQPSPGAPVVGVEIDRAALIADIVGALPEQTAVAGGRAVLAGAKGEPIYQWGDYERKDGEAPVAELGLGVPLSGWRLLYFAQSADTGGKSAAAGLVAGLVAVGIALLGMAVYFYRENSREMREAEQKVSFVNQVSHELKTPLTNIRMYAELAGEKLDEGADPGLEKCLGVVTDESGRLSRLIGNVLSFAKRGKGAAVRPAPTDIDARVAATVDLFRPSLERAGVGVELDASAGEGRVDGDALEQILANLFSNVEKYAASGGAMKVAARRDGDTTRVTVEDRGPGVPRAQRERVFAPFARLDDSVTEGASGTGIGLAIARELARAHGGDLKLEEADGGGCRFVLTVKTPDC